MPSFDIARGPLEERLLAEFGPHLVGGPDRVWRPLDDEVPSAGRDDHTIRVEWELVAQVAGDAFGLKLPPWYRPQVTIHGISTVAGTGRDPSEWSFRHLIDWTALFAQLGVGLTFRPVIPVPD
jgi:hypothetical protein